MLASRLGNKLNEEEIASQPLKAGAVKLHSFLTEPLPDLASIKKHRDRLPIITEWQGRAERAIRSFLKANGGKLHDEFRELWQLAFYHCGQAEVDAAAKWLDEQFQITQAGVASDDVPRITEQPDGAATDGPAVEPAEPATISESPETPDAEVRPTSGYSTVAVESLQDDQKPHHRRNRRGTRQDGGESS